MVFEQPVLYDFNKLAMPVLIIVGQLDRTILGKEKLDKRNQQLHGNYPLLARKAAKSISNCKVIILPGIGHIPHVQEPLLFNQRITEFLRSNREALNR